MLIFGLIMHTSNTHDGNKLILCMLIQGIFPRITDMIPIPVPQMLYFTLKCEENVIQKPTLIQRGFHYAGN